MKRIALPLLGTGLLASCAPTLNTPVTGRIVNTSTGQEGTITFTRGTLQPRLDGPNAPNNVSISLGGQTYTGRTVILNTSTSTPSWNTRFDWIYPSRPWNTTFGLRTGFDLPSQTQLNRTGNLIARTTTNPPQTMTCNLTIDPYEHGIGDCIDGQGTRYALQF